MLKFEENINKDWAKQLLQIVIIKDAEKAS